ncbi:MAG TPA: hypothetical protein HA252_05070 [Candidatus Diapherotrites archaeon]|uniref:Uncharacterized protein n=1 Tax=Candidatus Iainarchaeum sp. TaxID=3101447 RepID=A0A7J4JG48_9ARCH|nr:hypothetical protein [Candidatus Diapherotrites archaeon]HIH16751.1 hypothetical protein [Candidatus Diapherotrites archaeon]
MARVSGAQAPHFPQTLLPAGKRVLGLDEKGQSEWSSIYLLIVFMIAALLLITLVKQMFRRSQPIRQSAEKIL